MINTRFNIADNVFIYQKGKLIPANVAEIDAHVTDNKADIKYGFIFSKQPGTEPVWLPEEEVFASKEEILTK